MTLHNSTFEYLRPTDEQLLTMNTMRIEAANYAHMILRSVPAGPDRAYILRKLRELSMWVNVAITRDADGAPRV